MVIVVPHASSSRSYQDPTHTRYMVERTWWYFGRPKEFDERDLPIDWYGADYGIDCRFVIDSNETVPPTDDLHTLLVKPC